MFQPKDIATTQKVDTTTRSTTRSASQPSPRLGCLVVGPSEKRAALLSGSAEDSGWATSLSESPKKAKAQIIRERISMAVVDLESEAGKASEELKDLAERLAREKNLLLVLCGNEGNAMEEIWARQLGVWLYLPGVVDDSDLKSLFDEAKRIAQRRQTVQGRRGRGQRGAASA